MSGDADPDPAPAVDSSLFDERLDLHSAVRRVADEPLPELVELEE
jgi:hypothetical protein